ncbi:RbsD/FucU family protein [Paracoccus lutimaris]|uniref:L-fucose mutarotase n=1 Tax=Paracoccus lutimaris TaxID=1490030 RepID=A0A368Z8Y8_9RHOB|nr:RbsD/FucU domain-containing protein [Paracoccus lutimaris]RCW88925.1 L-fucose mutarotase [Paracoccus lutimaris]
MLKGIDPLISPDLLQVLARMGHGDTIAIVDANFPAASVGSRTVHGQPLRIDCSVPRAVQAVLSLMPIDGFEPDSVVSMQVVGDAEAIPEVVAEARPLFAAEGHGTTGVERFEFYRLAGAAFVILHTTETRLYGNFIIRKGVVELSG